MQAAPDPSTVRITGPWVHRDVSANGIRLHVAEAGTGPMVLLLHGFAECWWTWHRQLSALADAGFRAVALDLRGYGDSDKPPRGYDAWTLAGDIAGLIRAVGERTAHLVGHGWGAMLACATAAMHPRVADSISLLGGAHPLALRSAIARTAFRRKRANQARASGHLLRFQVPMTPERWLTREDAAAVAELFRRWAASDWNRSDDFVRTMEMFRCATLVPGVAHSAVEYYRWAFRAQFRGEGRRFTRAMDAPLPAPTLHLYGTQDRCVLPATARASAPWLGEGPGPEPIADVGHFPHLEAPRRTNDALLTFLRECPSPRER